MSPEENLSCDLCGLSFSAEETLREHLWSMIHHIKVENRKRNAVHTCTLCFQVCKSLSEYSRHLNGPSHRKVLESKQTKKEEMKLQATQDANKKPPGLSRSLGDGQKQVNFNAGHSQVGHHKRWSSQNPSCNQPSSNAPSYSFDSSQRFGEPNSWSGWSSGNWSHSPWNDSTSQWHNRNPFHAPPNLYNDDVAFDVNYWSFENSHRPHSPWQSNEFNSSHSTNNMRMSNGSRRSSLDNRNAQFYSGSSERDLNLMDKRSSSRHGKSVTDDTIVAKDKRSVSKRGTSELKRLSPKQLCNEKGNNRKCSSDSVVHTQATLSAQNNETSRGLLNTSHSIGKRKKDFAGNSSVRSHKTLMNMDSKQPESKVVQTTGVVTTGVVTTGVVTTGVVTTGVVTKPDVLEEAENMCRELREKRQQARELREKQLAEKKTEMKRKASGSLEIRERVEKGKTPQRLDRERDCINERGMDSQQPGSVESVASACADTYHPTGTQARPLTLTKDNLTQLINNPTQKQKASIAQLLHKHAQQKSVHRLHVSSSDEVTLADIQALNFHDMPDDLKVQISMILEMEKAATLPDSSSEVQNREPENTCSDGHQMPSMGVGVSQENECSSSQGDVVARASGLTISNGCEAKPVLSQCDTNVTSASSTPQSQELPKPQRRPKVPGVKKAKVPTTDTPHGIIIPKKSVWKSHYQRLWQFCRIHLVDGKKLRPGLRNVELVDLNLCLEKFYKTLAQKTVICGEPLNVAWFKDMHNSVSYVLHLKRGWNILTQEEFSSSNKVFLDCLSTLENRKPEPEEEAVKPACVTSLLKRLVTQPQFGDHSPQALQTKVALDLILLFRCSTMAKLQRDWLEIRTNVAGEQFLHSSRRLQSSKTAKKFKIRDPPEMRALTGCRLCPIKTFKMYCDKLAEGGTFFRECSNVGPYDELSKWYTGPNMEKPHFLVKSLVMSTGKSVKEKNWFFILQAIRPKDYLLTLQTMFPLLETLPHIPACVGSTGLQPTVVLNRLPESDVSQIGLKSSGQPENQPDQDTDQSHRTHGGSSRSHRDVVQSGRVSSGSELDSSLPFPCSITKEESSKIHSDTSRRKNNSESENVTNSWTMSCNNLRGQLSNSNLAKTSKTVKGSCSTISGTDGDTTKVYQSRKSSSLTVNEVPTASENQQVLTKTSDSKTNLLGNVGGNADSSVSGDHLAPVKASAPLAVKLEGQTHSVTSVQHDSKLSIEGGRLETLTDQFTSSSTLGKKRKRQSLTEKPEGVSTSGTCAVPSEAQVSPHCAKDASDVSVPKSKRLKRPVAKPRKKQPVKGSLAMSVEDIALIDTIVKQTFAGRNEDNTATVTAGTSALPEAVSLGNNTLSEPAPSISKTGPTCTTQPSVSLMPTDSLASKTTPPEGGVMNRVLQMSLEEEAILREKRTVEEHVGQLQMLLRKTQEEMVRCQHQLTQLTKREEFLRKSRLSILQGAVTSTSASISSPAGSQSTVTTSTAVANGNERSVTPGSMIHSSGLRLATAAEQKLVESISVAIKKELPEEVSVKPTPRPRTNYVKSAEKTDSQPTSTSCSNITIVKSEPLPPAAERHDTSQHHFNFSNPPEDKDSQPPGSKVSGQYGQKATLDTVASSSDDGLEMRYLGKVKPVEFAKYLAFSQPNAYSIMSEDEFQHLTHEQPLSESEAGHQPSQDDRKQPSSIVETSGSFKVPSAPKPDKQLMNLSCNDGETSSDSSVIVVSTLASNRVTEDTHLQCEQDIQQHTDASDRLETARSLRTNSAQSTCSNRRRVSQFYPDPDSPVRKKLRKKKERDQATRLTRTSESNSDTSTVEQSSSSSKTRKCKKKNGVYKKLTEWLAEESSDVEIEGLDEAPPVKLSGNLTNEKESLACTGPLVFDECHKQSILCLALYKEHVYAAGQDGIASKHNITSGKLVKHYNGHKKAINCIVVTETRKCGTMVLTGGRDKSLIVFNEQTGAQISLSSFADEVTCMCEQWSRVYVGLNNGNVMCFNPKTKQCMDGFKSSEQAICGLVCATEGSRRLLCISSMDSIISVRDANSGLLLRNLQGTSHGPGRLFLANRWLYSASRDVDKVLQCHDIHTGQLIHVIKHKGGVITDLHYLKKKIYICSLDGIVHCLNLQDNSTVCVYGSGNELLTSMIVKDDMIITGNRKGVIGRVPIPTEHYECQFGSCSSVFGLKEHVVHHVVVQHILPNKSVIRCLWKDCKEWISTSEDKTNARKHIEKHMASV